MKVLLVGGGSGGHLTPLIAVATAIRELDSSATVECIGQSGENLTEVLDNSAIHGVHYISAGKFRRYHGESFISHILDFKTILLNIRDLFRFAWGTIQAWRLLGKLKPDSIFLKGGYVSVPVGYAARLRKIPYITHDSDAVPGLANRMTSTHARFNTTALPIEHYPYDHDKAVQVGIPVQEEYKFVTDQDKVAAKLELGLDETTPVVLSVGGGLGAQRLNHALVRASSDILSSDDRLNLFHLTGKKLFGETKNMYEENLKSKYIKRVEIIDFTTELFNLSAAADVVITRGGATNIAEFALQGKPCIVVPNPVLTGGQQLHNAAVLQASDAAVILHEEELDSLAEQVLKLLSDAEEQTKYQENIRKLAYNDSASKIAEILLNL